jgi:hypothetical protein
MVTATSEKISALITLAVTSQLCTYLVYINQAMFSEP